MSAMGPLDVWFACYACGAASGHTVPGRGRHTIRCPTCGELNSVHTNDGIAPRGVPPKADRPAKVPAPRGGKKAIAAREQCEICTWHRPPFITRISSSGDRRIRLCASCRSEAAALAVRYGGWL